MNLKERTRSEVLHLLASAEACIQGGEADCAIWRLIDAAGLIATDLPAQYRKTLCGLGVENATGRGFALTTNPISRTNGTP